MKEIDKHNIANKENEGVIKYLDKLSLGPGIVHPDIKDKLVELCKFLDNISLRRYKNSIVIVNQKSNLILVAAFGTIYVLRTGLKYSEAIKVGAKTKHKFSLFSSLNLRTFGSDWVVGMWHKNEVDWIRTLNA